MICLALDSPDGLRNMPLHWWRTEAFGSRWYFLAFKRVKCRRLSVQICGASAHI